MEIVFWYLVIGAVVSSLNFIHRHHPILNQMGTSQWIVGVVVWPLVIIGFTKKNWWE